MITYNVHDELKNIIQGKSKVCDGELIQAITSYLRKCHLTSAKTQASQYNKHQETKRLIDYCNENNLWISTINFNLYLAEGAEQRVFIQGNKKVLKLNDSINYLTWLDYFNNLLRNNYFFPDTELINYQSEKNVLYALVEQNYVESNQQTDLK